MFIDIRIIFFVAAVSGVIAQSAPEAIDREAVVRRHCPALEQVDTLSPLSVGNGPFAFTCDITGLQTFDEAYRSTGIGMETQASWAWHSYPNPNGYTLSDAFEFYDTHGRSIGYPTKANTPAGQWLRENPHRFALARIGMDLRRVDGTAATLDDIRQIRQRLNLWTGVIESRFEFDGESVAVTTCCHPTLDLVAVRIESPLVGMGRLRVNLGFPYGYDFTVKHSPPLQWKQPDRHSTRMTRRGTNRADFERVMDETRYFSSISWIGKGTIDETEKHHYRFSAAKDAAMLEFICGFGQNPLPSTIPTFVETRTASVEAWANFWKSGGAIDFSACTDPRAIELERRVVLSQYLTRIQLVGETPPQESGLTVNTWFGKHHTEMIWWHTAHFALWGRAELLEKNLAWYRTQLPTAQELAKHRGLTGARWAKMVGFDGRESPGGNPFIIWNQPHPIVLAELVYRARPQRQTLELYKDLVFESAECMASFAWLDPKRGQYVLGPPLWLAQEIYDQATSQNPTFELSYWVYGLKTAQEWRGRLGMDPDPKWAEVIARISPLPTRDGLYVGQESHPDTFINAASRRDHPTMLSPIGLLPGDLADADTMRRTLDAVVKTWDWKAKIWGWDYPMIAMTAARLGQPQRAVDILLSDGPNNQYTAAGHCPQRKDLRVYLPANGATLAAVAMMAAGWDGAASHDAPGFPTDGKWMVKWEGLMRLP
ncbi:MAG: hypothetical protein GX455_09420 [Phycisphaerae bacterium]|nr:hypothetical protein [Phycisphaerae bacterium]